MTTFYKCDRCNVELDSHYTYEIENKYYTLCKPCVDLIKQVLQEYWDKSKPYDRLGRIPKDFVENKGPTWPDGFPSTREKIGNKIPVTHFNTGYEKTPEVESHHALARFFYWLFYKKVEVEK